MHDAMRTVPIAQAAKQALIAIILAPVLLALVFGPFIAVLLAIWGY